MGFLSALNRKRIVWERNLTEDPNQFILMQTLLAILTIKSDASSDVPRRMICYCNCLIIPFVLASFCYKTYWYLTHSDHGSSMAYVIGTIWICIGALFRWLIYNRPVLVRLERFLNDRSFRGEEKDIDAERQRLKRQNNRYLTSIVIALLVEVFIFLGTNLTYQQEFMLMYEGHVVGGLLVQIGYGLITCYCGSLYVIIFAIIYSMLNVFRLEMKILVCSFKLIDQWFRENRPILNGADFSVAREQKCWNDLQGLLKKNIKRHVELLENLAVFRSILGPFSFVQYYGSLVLIAYYCFTISYNGLTFLTVVYIAFICFLILESFMFCRIISDLNNLNANVGDALYELEWYNGLRYSPRFASEYRQIRKTFLIVMIRSQTPLPFTMNGSKTITMSRFVDLLNSSYSIMVLLLQLKSRGWF